MIARTRRAFPGMVVSVMLACPGIAQAAVQPGTDSASGKAEPAAEHRKPVTRAPRHVLASPSPRSARGHGASGAGYRFATLPKQVQSFALSSTGPAGDTHWHQTGIASWYGGSRWQGHLTSSGLRYDQDAFTAAHATLPIGTKVRVTVEGSGQSVIVTINDRPGSRRRIIDLSRGAAAELGILGRGIAVVTLSAL